MKKTILLACLLGCLTVTNAAQKVGDFTSGSGLSDAAKECGDYALVFNLDEIDQDDGVIDFKFMLTPAFKYEMEYAFYTDLWYNNGAWLARYYYGIGSGSNNFGEKDFTASGTFVMQHSVVGDTGTITFSLLENNDLTVLASASGTSYAAYYEDNNITLGDDSYWKIVLGSEIMSKATVWDGIVTASDLIASEDTPAVPEPTTATLSLLALAGLAARRRRK